MNRSLTLTGLFGTLALATTLILSQATAALATVDGPADRAPINTPTAAPAHEQLSAIRLQATGAPATAWTVVQWKDALGNWHDVDGWRGEFDPDGYKTWRFPRQHFGTGPFRWQVFASRDGALWGSSEPFQLPDGPDQTLGVAVRSR